MILHSCNLKLIFFDFQLLYRHTRSAPPKPTFLNRYETTVEVVFWSMSLLFLNAFFFYFFIFLLKTIYFKWNRITVYYCDGFWHIHQHESATWIHVSRYPEHNSNLPCYPMASGFFHSTRVGCIFHALHLHWASLLYMVIYLFQCYFLKSSHPWTLPLSLRVCSLYVDLFY